MPSSLLSILTGLLLAWASASHSQAQQAPAPAAPKSGVIDLTKVMPPPDQAANDPAKPQPPTSLSASLPPPSATAAPASSKTSSTTADGQFIIHGADLLTRTEVGQLCDSIAQEMRTLLHDKQPPGIPIVVSLRVGDEIKKDLPPVDTEVDELESGGFRLAIKVQYGPELDERLLRSEVIRMLVAERIMRGHKALSTKRERILPQWVLTGIREAMTYRAKGRPSSLFARIFRSGQVSGISDILESDPGNLSLNQRTIYEASACALVLALLDQHEGHACFLKFLSSLAVESKTDRQLLNQAFPILGGSESSLDKWWSLQLASLAQPTPFEHLSARETDKAITEALTFTIIETVEPDDDTAPVAKDKAKDKEKDKDAEATDEEGSSGGGLFSRIFRRGSSTEEDGKAKPERTEKDQPPAAAETSGNDIRPARSSKPNSPAANEDKAPAPSAKPSTGILSGLFRRDKDSAETPSDKPDTKDEKAKPKPEPKPAAKPEPKPEKSEKPEATEPPRAPGILRNLFRRDKPKAEDANDKAKAKDEDEAKAKDEEKDKDKDKPTTLVPSPALDFSGLAASGPSTSAGLQTLSSNRVTANALSLAFPTLSFIADLRTDAAPRATAFPFFNRKKDNPDEAAAKAKLKELEAAERQAKADAAKAEKEAKAKAALAAEVSARKAEAEAMAKQQAEEAKTPPAKPEAKPEAKANDDKPAAAEAAPSPAPPAKKPAIKRTVTLTLDDHAKLLQRPDANRLLDQAARNLALLETRAHVLLRPVIKEYIAILSLLQERKNKIKDLDQRLADQKRARTNALAITKSALELMDRYELEHPEHLIEEYRELLSVFDEVKAMRPKRTDPVGKLLDEYEEKLDRGELPLEFWIYAIPPRPEIPDSIKHLLKAPPAPADEKNGVMPQPESNAPTSAPVEPPLPTAAPAMPPAAPSSTPAPPAAKASTPSATPQAAPSIPPAKP